MNTLILTRHAKSDWDDPKLKDSERPLNARGQAAAAAIGGWIASRGLSPARALVSTAERARETWERLAPELESEAEAAFVAALYQASPERMLATLVSEGGEGSPLIMIGHNPGIAAFARALLPEAPADPDFGRYPTGATAVIEFSRPWAETRFGSGSLREFIIPRRL